MLIFFSSVFVFIKISKTWLLFRMRHGRDIHNYGKWSSSCPQIRMRDDALPLAHIAIAVEGASAASPDIVPLMVANAIIGSYDLTYGGGKVGNVIYFLKRTQCRKDSNDESVTVVHHDIIMLFLYLLSFICSQVKKCCYHNV